MSAVSFSALQPREKDHAANGLMLNQILSNGAKCLL
jgi:hypothetical protein